MYQLNENQRFGRWTVITGKRDRSSGKAMVLCRCDCGIEKMIDIGRLCRSQTTMCKSCSPMFHRQNLGKGKVRVGDISGAYVYHLKQNAKQRNLEYKLTVKFLWELFQKQNSKCALSGLPIKMTPSLRGYNGGKKTNPDFRVITASLDRIDSRKGYIEGNVQWVHKVINIIKGELTMDQLYYVCFNISNNLKLKYGNNEPSLSVEDLFVTFTAGKKVQRLTDEVILTDNSDTSAAGPTSEVGS